MIIIGSSLKMPIQSKLNTEKKNILSLIPLLIFANCNNKLSIQLARSLLFEEDPAQLRREP